MRLQGLEGSERPDRLFALLHDTGPGQNILGTGGTWKGVESQCKGLCGSFSKIDRQPVMIHLVAFIGSNLDLIGDGRGKGGGKKDVKRFIDPLVDRLTCDDTALGDSC